MKVLFWPFSTLSQGASLYFGIFSFIRVLASPAKGSLEIFPSAIPTLSSPDPTVLLIAFSTASVFIEDVDVAPERSYGFVATPLFEAINSSFEAIFCNSFEAICSASVAPILSSPRSISPRFLSSSVYSFLSAISVLFSVLFFLGSQLDLDQRY